MPWRVIVMGSTGFVLPSLERLLASPNHDVVAVYTRPPAAKGRGHQVQRTDVHERVLELGIPVETPGRFRDEGAVERFASYRPDIVVTGAYGLILPQPVLDVPRFGCVNLHASLLPRWRGAAPIERAILAGDEATGVCLFRMEAGLDTGPVYARGEVPIGADTTALQLHETLAQVAADLLLPTLEGICSGRLEPVPQPAEGITYAGKLEKDEGRLDFRLPAQQLHRMVRALEPRPGTFAFLGDERIAVRAASVVKGVSGNPGEVAELPLVVACGKDGLSLDIVQRPGKKAMAAADLVRGWPVPPGTRFDLP